MHARQNDHVGVGVIGMQWIFNVMARNGQANLAWKMLNQTTYPGWGYMVKHGATTIWELWNGNTANPAMNSQDHVMFIGDMLTWLFQYVGGIQSDAREPGFQHIVMKPHFLNGLTYVNTWHRSPYGKIISDWKIQPNGSFRWHVQVPANSFATVEVPAADANAVRLNGHKISNKPWIKFVAYVDGRAIYMLESGNYRFQSELMKN
jgi:alpha-L-rhamnosidase